MVGLFKSRFTHRLLTVEFVRKNGRTESLVLENQYFGLKRCVYCALWLARREVTYYIFYGSVVRKKHNPSLTLLSIYAPFGLFS